MVGVPRSKGCRICVQRRVRCDQTKPTCNNCKKGNRPCPGYGNDMKFQDEGPKLRKRFEKKAASESSDDESMPSATLEDTFETATQTPPDMPTDEFWQQTSQNLWEQSPDADGWEVAINPETTPPRSWISDPAFGEEGWMPADEVGYADGQVVRNSALGILEETEMTIGEGHLRKFLRSASDGRINSSGNPTLTPLGMDIDDPLGWMKLHSAFYAPMIQQNQLLMNFTQAMTPNIQSGVSSRAAQYHVSWLSRLPEMTGQLPLLDTTIRAVTLAHLSMQSRSPYIMRESSPYYGKALRLLNAALLDPDLGMTSETLSATILLSFYEMFSSSASESWIRHAGGAGTLMRIRGPLRHRYGFDREIFLAYRHALIIEAFEQDKACFLAEPEWRQLAADIHEDIRASGAIDPRNEIFDISEAFFCEMARVPGTCRDARHLPELSTLGGGGFDDIKADVKRRGKEHRTNLKSVYARFSAALRKLGQQPTTRMTSDPVIPTRYDYCNIFVASTHTGYWTILMILNAVLREMSRGVVGEGVAEDASFYMAENREMALDCCRSVDFMETSSFLGPFFAIFALRVAWNSLEIREEKLWTVRRLRKIGERNMSMAKGGLPMQQVDPGRQLPPAPRVRQAVEELDLLEAANGQMRESEVPEHTKKRSAQMKAISAVF